ncbi:hypothetical protein [Bradyrhizobium sp. UFLA05-112]
MAIGGDSIAIALETAPAEKSALADAVTAMQCTRATFDGKPVAPRDDDSF